MPAMWILQPSFEGWFDFVLWGGLTLAAVASAGHALLRKRDPRAALGWIVVCLALPGVGVFLYWLLGVNRIKTRARDYQQGRAGIHRRDPLSFPREEPHFQESSSEGVGALRNLADAVTRRPLLDGNRISPLYNGEQTYPAMLQAIEGAGHSICLSSYIFDNDGTGRIFARALAAAAERGAEVRILFDGVGEHYSFPTARRLFQGSRVKVGRFLPPSLSGRGIHFNLRNHRKILVVDGRIGFTGGMNIGDRHLAEVENPRRVIDVHFQVTGPVVRQMEEAFWEDWIFATGETFSPLPTAAERTGGALCRGISDGPNEDFEKLTWIIIGALNGARKSLRIMTPYFIPDRGLISAINAASLRGVQVEILLPAKNNLPYLAWATQAYLWEFLQFGTRIYLQPPPFVHSKLLLVDDEFALVGSANLDPRSLRLNFEFNLEIYDRELTGTLIKHFDAVRARSREISLEEMDARPLPMKLRDSFAKLFSPYL